MENSEAKQPEPPKTNLQELAGKSWNLELIISGAAIFFTTQLPGLIDSTMNYYLHDIQPQNDSEFVMFPMLAYSFFKVVAQALTLAFVAHFILRAFWVSLVGLHAVWPHGIRFDQIPNLSGNAPKFYEEKMGQLEPLIHRIDRLANQVFSFAFLVSLMGLGIGIVYLIFFSIILLFEQFLGKDSMPLFRQVLLFVFLAVSLSILMLNFLVRKNEWFKERFEDRVGMIGWHFGNILMPVFYRPLSYLTFAFASNVRRKRYYIVMALTFVLVLGGVFFTLVSKMENFRSRHILTVREMFGKGSSRSEIFENQYDNLRPEGEQLPPVCLPSEVISENHLPVFISFPRWLDNRVASFCPLPEPPSRLSKPEKRNFSDSLRLDCHRDFFKIWVNDSLVEQPEFVFQIKSGTKGLATFLPTNRFFKAGKKNILTVKIPNDAKRDSLEKYGEAIFWFFPD